MKDSYKLSIILPVFNEKDSLRIMVKILEATLDFPNEILVVYDDAMDNSIDAAKEMQKIFSNIKLVHNNSDNDLNLSLNNDLTIFFLFYSDLKMFFYKMVNANLEI